MARSAQAPLVASPSATAAAAAVTRLPFAGSSVAPVFPHSSQKQRVRAYVLLLVSDLTCIFLGFAIGSFIRFGDLSETTWLRIALAVIPLFVASAMHNRAYSLETLKLASVGACRATAALVSTFAILFVVSYFLKAEQDVSRLLVGSGVFATLVLTVAARKLVVGHIQRNFAGELTSTVIIADEKFLQPVRGARVIDAHQFGMRPEPRDPLMIQRLARLLDGADRVVIFCSLEMCSRWAAMLKATNVQGEILADQMSSVGAVGVGRIGDRTTLVVSARPLSAQQKMVKRLFDLALTIPALILLAPLMLLVALAIKLDNPGPALFTQQRVGLGNQFFKLYKFRSMAVGRSDELGTHSTERNDERLTRLGRFIRRTSIDELPQLWNVLNGSMSLVGPRPHAFGSFAGSRLFWDVDDRYAHRHTLKPGITGLAQIRGLRGTARHENDLSRRLQADLEYMVDWSIFRDLMIILRTFPVIVHPNAY
jgi:exopolysaccharide biosynthesis polyprenyl glycosylphosphotransferase